MAARQAGGVLQKTAGLVRVLPAEAFHSLPVPEMPVARVHTTPSHRQLHSALVFQGIHTRISKTHQYKMTQKSHTAADSKPTREYSESHIAIWQTPHGDHLLPTEAERATQ